MENFPKSSNIYLEENYDTLCMEWWITPNSRLLHKRAILVKKKTMGKRMI